MRLTTYTDYALRILMYVSLKEGEKATIKDISGCYKISKNHVMKIVHELGRAGLLATSRGVSGGVLLAKSPEEISLRDVMLITEPDFKIVECFDCGESECPLVGHCELHRTLNIGLKAFLDVMEGVTIADLVRSKGTVARLLNLPALQNQDGISNGVDVNRSGSAGG